MPTLPTMPFPRLSAVLVRPLLRSRVASTLLVCGLAGAALAGACQKNDKKPTEVPKTPTLRIFVASTIAGALEPCGCRKDMLGGVDHAAALVAKAKSEVPEGASMLVAAGPTLFMNPELSDEKKTQDLWKAESIAQALSDMGLTAWTPGANDFAAGLPTLQSLAQKTNAAVLAGNLKAPNVALAATRIVEKNGHKIGIAGVSHPKSGLGVPKDVTLEEAQPALQRGLEELKKSGAKINVALVSMERGAALRLAETVPGFQVMIIGKASDRGEGNDAPTAPVLIGSTLAVQAPNHLQALGIIDLYVRDGKLEFADAAGLAQAEERQSLERRTGELSRRIAEWETSGVSPKDVAERKKDLEKMQARLAQLSAPPPPAEGSFFRYGLHEVREGLGSEEKVEARMGDYYKRVNEHNKELFKNKTPKETAKGEAHYVGIDACAECHDDSVAFWKKTGHAGAYKTLSDDFKEFNLDCVSCHVTGYEQPGGSTVTFVENLKDVQCEECHGPGSKHVETEEAEFIVLKPTEDLCKKCHHAPHVLDDWSAKEAWTHIVGEGHGEGSTL